MQFKFFSIQAPGGEHVAEELNLFLRSKKVLSVERRLVSTERGVFWHVCVEYLDEAYPAGSREKVDYKKVLDDDSFARFARFKEIRKAIAQEESVPAYAIFTDEELAGMAKVSPLDAAEMRKIKGISDKKIEKYAKRFIQSMPDEKTQLSDAEGV
ncbi:MAG TPA: HRDC domain-containing protein [Saprospiraceae bacterium]|jgi:superfamily II DNA helicase RecQ|nr:HRDC domain-containing protein [Saprospiraceae bacterium]